jgi:hypothetical protein
VSEHRGGLGGSGSEAIAPQSGAPPLLVTGMPRTATSWVGKMLEASGALVYVNEPLNPQHPPGRSPGVLLADVEHAFQYISEENERVWLPAFQDTVRLRFHPLAELRRNHRPYDVARTIKYAAGFGLGRLRGAPGPARRPLRGVRRPLAGSPGRLPGGGHGPRPGGHRVQLAPARLDGRLAELETVWEKPAPRFGALRSATAPAGPAWSAGQRGPQERFLCCQGGGVRSGRCCLV